MVLLLFGGVLPSTFLVGLLCWSSRRMCFREQALWWIITLVL